MRYSIRIVPEWNVKRSGGEPASRLTLIRIVPEWNVKDASALSQIGDGAIRIVPEWNVKKHNNRNFNLEPELESYQSGM